STPGIQSTITNPAGTWIVNNSGDLTFTPAVNFNGPASISYQVNDDDGSTSDAVTMSVSVTPVNDPVIITADTRSTNEDTSVTFNVTSNDNDVDGTVNVSSVDLDPSTAGIQNTLMTPAGSWSVDNTGNVTFVPALNFNGPASISYAVNDDLGLTSAAGSITVSVNIVNDNPVAIADNLSTIEDTAMSFNPTLNDTDADGTINPAAFDLDPAANGFQTTMTTPEGVWQYNTAGSLTFTPVLNFNGAASISYTVGDNTGDISNAGLITIIVNAVNDPPQIGNKVFIATVGLNATGDLLAGGFDPEGTPLTVNTMPISGPSHGVITINANGDYTYVSNPGFTGTDIVVLQVCDGGLPLPAACVNMTLTLTVVMNQDPNVSTKRSTGIEDFPVAGKLLAAGDFDPEGLSLVVSQTPVSGPEHGSIVINTGGNYTYTPEANFNGIDTVRVQICDTNPVPSCTTTDLIITITPVNDAPILLPDIGTGDRNQSATGNILTGDVDPDGTLLVVNTTAISGPSHGVIVIDAQGNYTYKPEDNFVGEDQVLIEICDNGSPLPGLCVTSTLTITITDPLAGVIYIPEGFSPNGDQVNDTFVITYTGIEKVQFEVFNRWGNTVYSNDSYNNDWSGISTHGITIGKELPDGTYFYKVAIGSFKQVKSFTLQR
ncbi:MAG TPA: tandem-95 repeat protein, partial [Chryseolinea sp.]|nr:tandem-95 repeat protein [Chryseolinea sp.]